MIKYLYFLLTLSLIGCSSEPSFPNPIKPTENKTETIQKWMGYKHWYIGEDLKEQCKKSYLRLKNKYESILSDPSKKMISEQDYQELNNIYLEERKNVIDKINKIVKRCAETELKNKELNDYQNKNGLPITEDIYGSC